VEFDKSHIAIPNPKPLGTGDSTRPVETAFPTPVGPGSMALADREWRLIAEEAREGALNMAFDEVAAGTAAAGGPLTLRVYRWEPSTLSLGYHQPADTVDWTYCEREGVPVVRRPPGGGGM
jgi:hypothetical protein